MMRLEQMYQEVILDHYKHPHHRGLREPFGAEVHHVNPTCGDEITLRVALSGDGERIADVVRRTGLLDQPGGDVGADRSGYRSDGGDALKTVAAFTEMVSSRGTIDGDEDVLGTGWPSPGWRSIPRG